jgi:hypothetical protein
VKLTSLALKCIAMISAAWESEVRGQWSKASLGKNLRLSEK